MKAEEISNLRKLMEYEAARNAPPDGFPELPDIPGGRYTDQRFFDLEKEHVWRKSWLLACHIDEIPEPQRSIFRAALRHGEAADPTTASDQPRASTAAVDRTTVPARPIVTPAGWSKRTKLFAGMIAIDVAVALVVVWIVLR